MPSPRRNLGGVVSGADRSEVIIEGQAANGIEVGRHPHGNLRRPRNPPEHPGGGLQPDVTGIRPATGEARIGEGDQAAGVTSKRAFTPDVVLARNGGLGREAGDLDRAIRKA